MEVARLNRLKVPFLRLEGDLCNVCHKPTFPPKDVCPDCNVAGLLKITKSTGVIYSNPDTAVPVPQLRG